jgi:trimethylamine---corrinoid protein Co-methyltransferase
MVYSHIRYSDKPFMGSVTAPERAEDSVAMAKMVFGDEFVDNNCVLINLINANSPLVFDSTMIGALKVYARANQATVDLAVHPVGRHVAGHRCRHADPDPCRSLAGMAFAQLVPAGRAGGLRHCSPARSRCSRARPPSARPSPAYVLATARPSSPAASACRSAPAAR